MARKKSKGFDEWSVQDRASFAVQLGALAIAGIACTVVQFQDNGIASTPAMIAYAETVDFADEVEKEEKKPTSSETTTNLSKESKIEIQTTAVTTATEPLEESSSTTIDSKTPVSESSKVTTTETIPVVEVKRSIKAQNAVPAKGKEKVTTTYVQTLTSTVMTKTTTFETELTAEMTYETEAVKPGVAITLDEIDALDDFEGLVGSKYPVTKSEYILLCNLLGREYGANWVSDVEKAKVIECVMNRVHSSKFPNTVRGVLGQKRQFSGSLKLGDQRYRKNVTASVRRAVLNYLNGKYVNHGYKFYWGDGYRNHFRKNY